MRFYDRKKELAILQDIEQQSFDNAAFTVMMGRRRIGKPHSSRMHLPTRSMPTFSCLKIPRLYYAKISNETWSNR